MSNRTSDSVDDRDALSDEVAVISTDSQSVDSAEDWSTEEDSSVDDDVTTALDAPSRRAKPDVTLTIEGEESEFSEVVDDAPYAELDPRSALRYKIAIFTLLGLAAAMTVAAAVRFWLPPWAPAVIFLTLGVGPVFFWATVGALIFDPTKKTDGIVSQKSPPLRLRLKLALLPVAIAAVAGALLTSLWYFAPVRATAAHIGTSQRLSATLDSALIDQSASVRLAACEGLATLGDETSVRLLSSLNDRDDAVASCALDALQPQPVASTELATAGFTWRGELLQQPTLDGDRACMLSNRLRVAERKGLTQSPMYLMSCALDGASAPARECCAQSFRGLLGTAETEPHMVMMAPGELVRGGFLETLPSLLLATHSSEPEWEARRVALRLDTAASRAWSMGVACEALGNGSISVRSAITAAMATAVSTDTCQIGPAQETTVRLWTAVCSEVFPPTIAAVDGTESEKFCEAIEGTLIADANNAARQGFNDSLRRARRPGRQGAVMRALLDYSGKVASAAMEGKGAPPTGPTDIFRSMSGDGGDDDMFSEMMKIMSAGEQSEGAVYPQEMLQQFMKQGLGGATPDTE